MSKSTFLMGSVVGSRIKEERLRMNISQQEAADKCGVRRETWVRYENNKLEMGSAIFKAFTTLGADASYILTGVRSTAAEQAVLQRVSTVAANLLPEKADDLIKDALSNQVERAYRASQRTVEMDMIKVMLSDIDDAHFAKAKKQIEQVYLAFRQSKVSANGGE